ncbi:MAG: DpnI domain-containing protein [bacterium]
MANTKNTGDAGEQYVVENIACPNCGKPLMKLPQNYSLADVQCTGCVFRAQVKTISSLQKYTIRGADWDIMEKVLKAGHLITPMIAHFVWKANGAEHHKAVFYPFVPRKCLCKYQFGSSAIKVNYKMCNFSGRRDSEPSANRAGIVVGC